MSGPAGAEFGHPAIVRLASLARLDETDLAKFEAAIAEGRRIPPQGHLLHEGRPIGKPLLLLSGWAARLRFLADGRRQVLALVLPGDVMGMHRGARPVAAATIQALTEVTVCPAPLRDSRNPRSGLADAYDAGRALEEAYLYAQITRLGRMSAQDRIADLLLELRDRLALAGIGDERRFPLPLTQDLLADMLGLTSVHVNRTLQAMRREGRLTLGNGQATLRDVEWLASTAGQRRPALG